jgi:hypothetical protein
MGFRNGFEQCGRVLDLDHVAVAGDHHRRRRDASELLRREVGFKELHAPQPLEDDRPVVRAVW